MKHPACKTCGDKGKVPYVSGPRFMFHKGPLQPGDEEIVVMAWETCPACKGKPAEKKP